MEHETKTTDEKAKVIERVKKLLAMASDVASPKEAVIASKRARALMDQHQITKGMLQDESQFGETTSALNRKARPVWMQWLSVSVAKWNDCQTYAISDCGVFSFVFRGFKADTIVATYTYEYLRDRCLEMLEKSQIKGRSNRNQYLLGISDQICKRIYLEIEKRTEDVVDSSGRSLAVIKSQLVDAEFGEQKYESGGGRDPTPDEISARVKGQLDGSKVGLDLQIDGSPDQIQISA